jgi:pyruvate/2-oxoglutarate dehydrogenase complex dihydrolipoamide dehydrogenase (E3) component
MTWKNSMFGGKLKFSDVAVPRVTFTEPELATVGRSEAQLEDADVRHRAFS